MVIKSFVEESEKTYKSVIEGINKDIEEGQKPTKENAQYILLTWALSKEKNGDQWTIQQEKELQKWIEEMIKKKFFRKDGERLIVSPDGTQIYYPKSNCYGKN